MDILEPALPEQEATSDKSFEELSILKGLIRELRKKSIPSEALISIKREIMELNSYHGSEREFTRKIKKCKNAILKISTSRLGYFPKNYHKNMWLALGMAVFGLPLGAAMGLMLDNIALLAVGMPIGLAAGLGLGAVLDKRVADRSNDLNVDMY